MEIVDKLKGMVLPHDSASKKEHDIKKAAGYHDSDDDRTHTPGPGGRASFAIARGKKYMKAETLDEDVKDYTQKLQPFQLKKLQTWFDVMLDADSDGYLTKRDMEMTARRLAEIAGWPLDGDDATSCKDSLRSILEAFLDVQQQNIHDGKISRTEFVNFMAKTSRGSASVKDFPYQVQLIPRLLFHAIGSGKNELTPQDLNKFYRAYLPKADQGKDLDSYTQRAYRAMTANGTIPLTQHVYGLVFSNFLLGRSQQTPGKYILPCFDVDGQIDAKRYHINWETSA